MSIWKKFLRESGATGWECRNKNFHATIVKSRADRFTYDVAELPVGPSSFHTRRTVSSLDGAKKAARRVMKRRAPASPTWTASPPLTGYHWSGTIHLNPIKKHCIFIGGWWSGYHAASEIPALVERATRRNLPVRVFESYLDACCLEHRSLNTPEQALKSGFREIK